MKDLIENEVTTQNKGPICVTASLWSDVYLGPLTNLQGSLNFRKLSICVRGFLGLVNCKPIPIVQTFVPCHTTLSLFTVPYLLKHSAYLGLLSKFIVFDVISP